MKFNLLSGAKHTRLRRGIAAGAALVVGSGVFVLAANQASAAAGCSVTYSANQWPGGFTANLGITNLGDPLSSWTLEWDYAGGQTVTQAWNSVSSQSGSTVSLRNAAWNGSLGTGATVNPGFNGAWSGSNPAPTAFRLNGVACNGDPTVTTPPGNTTTTPPVTVTTPPVDTTTGPPPVTTTGPPPVQGTHVDNPYVGARGYVNSEWAAKVRTVAGGDRIANQPTAVWMDRIAAIEGSDNSSSNGSMGMRDHLDAALAQGAGYIQFVIYNLPGRDCAALASNGELPATAAGMARYENEYINPIATIQKDPKYRNLRIINIIEIDSLPNLITNAGSGAGSTTNCQTMLQNGYYQRGIAYALTQLTASNIYKYVDAAHHGWIGWPTNFGPAAELFATTARLATGGVNTVDGFITNTANYSALRELYFNANTTVNGAQIQTSRWVDWNPYVDELSFAQAFRQRLVAAGFNSNIGMLIDTSRNGWGGPNRPTGPSSSTDVNTFVNESRIDRRIHAGNWCNQSGAGLGERPRATPEPGIDAYVWVKPPGESDGSSTLIPNNEGKGFDEMCSPTYTGNARNGMSLTGALPNAPISGAFFPAQLAELMRNAYPAL